MVEGNIEQQEFLRYLDKIVNEWLEESTLNDKYTISTNIISDEISEYIISSLTNNIPNIISYIVYSSNVFIHNIEETLYKISPYSKDIYISSILYGDSQLKITIEVIPITTETYIDINTVLDIDNMYCELSYEDKIINISKYLGLTIGGNIKDRLFYYLELNSDDDIIQLLEKADYIRNILHLTTGIWRCLPNSLLIIAFIKNSIFIDNKIAEELRKRYNNQDNYETFEFLGDAVLELITRNELIKLTNYNFGPKYLTNKASFVVRNSNLHYLMHNKDLCIEIITDKVGKKSCADSFEAILGILYYYLTHILSTPYALDHIRDWLNISFDFNTVINNIINSNADTYNSLYRLLDNCKYNNLNLRNVDMQRYNINNIYITKFKLYKLSSIKNNTLHNNDTIVIVNRRNNKEILCANIFKVKSALRVIFKKLLGPKDIPYLSDNCKIPYNNNMKEINLDNYNIPQSLKNDYYIMYSRSGYILFYDKSTKLLVYCINHGDPEYEKYINNAIEYLTFFSQY